MELPLERSKNTDLEQIEIGGNDVSDRVCIVVYLYSHNFVSSGKQAVHNWFCLMKTIPIKITNYVLVCTSHAHQQSTNALIIFSPFFSFFL